MKNLNHTIIPPNPSLFTFNLPKNDLLTLQGLVANVEVKILGSKFSESGPLLVNSLGCSRPWNIEIIIVGSSFLKRKKLRIRFYD
jgi:predicted flavoprotein YhiN